MYTVWPWKMVLYEKIVFWLLRFQKVTNYKALKWTFIKISINKLNIMKIYYLSVYILTIFFILSTMYQNVMQFFFFQWEKCSPIFSGSFVTQKEIVKFQQKKWY